MTCSRLAPEIVQVADAGSHWREEILLSSHAHMEIPCYLTLFFWAPARSGRRDWRRT